MQKLENVKVASFKIIRINPSDLRFEKLSDCSGPCSEWQKTLKPLEIDQQTEFRHNSKFIRHKKTCPTPQHPQNPPKTTKISLKS